MSLRLTAVEAFSVRLVRSAEAALGTAGSPAGLQSGSAEYRWSESVAALYAVHFETALVRIRTDAGITGWGEAQAPLVPEVACTLVNRLLAAVLAGEGFDGTPSAIEHFWQRMYQTMRVRGHTGGFMLDAIAGVDLALWDLAGKMAGRGIADLLGGLRRRVPAYVSGLPRTNRLAAAETFFQENFRTFKLFLEAAPEVLLADYDRLRARFGDQVRIAVDALWRLDLDQALAFGRALDQRNALWLECPMMPEDAEAHGRLARALRTPIALGESYRTRWELVPFFRERAVGILQPDLGRCGITESLRLSRLAAGHGVEVVPHLSIALGPQIAAAVHFAAAAGCPWLEYNPAVLEVANRLLVRPIAVDGQGWTVPEGPGLGVEWNENATSLFPAMSGGES